MLESLSFEVKVVGDKTEDFVGSVFQKVEEILGGLPWDRFFLKSLVGIG